MYLPFIQVRTTGPLFHIQARTRIYAEEGQNKKNIHIFSANGEKIVGSGLDLETLLLCPESGANSWSKVGKNKKGKLSKKNLFV